VRLAVLTPGFASTLALATLPAQSDTLRAAVIQGIVRDTLGRPLPRARVQLLTDSIAPVTGLPGRVTHHQSTVRFDSTDASGRFRFVAIRPYRYVLWSTAIWMEGRLDSLVLAPNDTVTVEVRMRVRSHEETPAPVRTANLARLAEAEGRWAARRPARYRLTAWVECFCIPGMDKPTTLEFRNDSLVGVVSRWGRLRPAPNEGWGAFSVPALFAAADSAIRDPETFVTKLEFDRVYGVPTLIGTNTVYLFTDAWALTHVRDFRPVP
jgi:hypothetical protein